MGRVLRVSTGDGAVS